MENEDRPKGIIDKTCKHVGGVMEPSAVISYKMLDDLCLQDGGPFDGKHKYEIINPSKWHKWKPLYPVNWFPTGNETASNKYGHWVTFLMSRFLALFLVVGTQTLYVPRKYIDRLCNFVDLVIFPRDVDKPLEFAPRIQLATEVYSVCARFIMATTPDLHKMGLQKYLNFHIPAGPDFLTKKRWKELTSIAGDFITKIVESSDGVHGYTSNLTLERRVASHLNQYLKLNKVNHLSLGICKDIVLKIRLWLVELHQLKMVAFDQFDGEPQKLAIKRMPETPNTNNSHQITHTNNRNTKPRLKY